MAKKKRKPISEERELTDSIRVADELLCEERGIVTPLDSADAPWAPIPTKDSLPVSATPPAGPVPSLASKLRKGTAPKQPPHIIVIARAGTGKTFTLVEGIAAMQGCQTIGQPSEQQRAIWDAMALSRDAQSIGAVCFNKSIATVLQTKLKQRNIRADAMTMHSMGYKAVRRAFPSIQLNEYRVDEIVCRLLLSHSDTKVLRREYPVVLMAAKEMVRHIKSSLLPCDYGNEVELRELHAEFDRLASHYDVEFSDDNGNNKTKDGRTFKEIVYELLPQIIECCADPSSDGCIDFDDMVWLPVRLNLPVFTYDFLLVDEAQDLTPCQRALAKRAGRRLFLCGDDRQAIYGFAGAATSGLSDAQTDLASSDRGVTVFPLTVTRRCGIQIVLEARKIVKDFEAHGWEIIEDSTGGEDGQPLVDYRQTAQDSTPEGEISEDRYPLQRRSDGTWYELPVEDTYIPLVREGDMILCRVNAPLVSQCFRFLKMGKKASIQGRDVGKGLLKTIEKVGAHSVPLLIAGIEEWCRKEMEAENAKRNPSESRLINIQDRRDCLLCFCDGADTVEAVRDRIARIFTDNRDEPGIRLSSIHRAKGLEADRVFFLMPAGAGCPHPMAKSGWQIQQEWNLRYVAVTRAIRELIYVY